MSLPIRYDARRDMLIIEVRAGEEAKHEESVGDSVVLLYNDRKELVRVEVRNALKKGLLKILRSIASGSKKIVSAVTR